jgi:hypothetical protein
MAASGTMYVATAVLIVISPRTPSSHINPLDSFYWWWASIISITTGIILLTSEKHILKFLPFHFLILFPVLNIHETIILGKSSVEIFPVSIFLSAVRSFQNASVIMQKDDNVSLQRVLLAQF